MRRTAAPFVALSLISAASARAGTLTSATWVTDLGLTGPIIPTTPFPLPVVASGTSSATSVSVNLSLPQFTTEFFAPKNPTTGVLDLAITVSQGGAQLVTATPSMAAATTPVPGTLIVMTAPHLSGGTNASMLVVGINTLVNVPLSVGVNGQFTSTFSVLAAVHQLTVDFYAWTPGTASFMGLTSKGSALPDVVAMGSFALTAMGGGTVTLVSPSKLSINGSLARRRTASYTTLQLHFVPEPGSALLLAAAAVSLALVARRRAH